MFSPNFSRGQNVPLKLVRDIMSRPKRFLLKNRSDYGEADHGWNGKRIHLRGVYSPHIHKEQGGQPCSLFVSSIRIYLSIDTRESPVIL